MDVSININNLFIFIQNKENKSIIDFLAKNGIETKDEFGRTPLINAALYNNTDLIEWLIKNRVNINAKDNNGYTALHFAAQEANNDSLNLLIENGADLNIQDINGNTPSWICVMYWKGGKNLNNLKKLYKNGADLTIKNNAGKNAKEIIPDKIMNELKN